MLYSQDAMTKTCLYRSDVSELTYAGWTLVMNAFVRLHRIFVLGSLQFAHARELRLDERFSRFHSLIQLSYTNRTTSGIDLA